MSKMNTLRTLKNKDTHGHFRTMKSMVAFEREQNLLNRSGYTSGSRTLLRLHRGLGKNFIINTQFVFLLFFFSN